LRLRPTLPRITAAGSEGGGFVTACSLGIRHPVRHTKGRRKKKKKKKKKEVKRKERRWEQETQGVLATRNPTLP
jgi:hypothetical protein